MGKNNMKEYRVTVETSITVMADSFESAKGHATHTVRNAVEEAMEESTMDVIDAYDAVVYDYEYVEAQNCVMIE